MSNKYDVLDLVYIEEHNALGIIEDLVGEEYSVSLIGSGPIDNAEYFEEGKLRKPSLLDFAKANGMTCEMCRYRKKSKCTYDNLLIANYNSFACTEWEKKDNVL